MCKVQDFKNVVLKLQFLFKFWYLVTMVEKEFENESYDLIFTPPSPYLGLYAAATNVTVLEGKVRSINNSNSLKHKQNNELCLDKKCGSELFKTVLNVSEVRVLHTEMETAISWTESTLQSVPLSFCGLCVWSNTELHCTSEKSKRDWRHNKVYGNA